MRYASFLKSSGWDSKSRFSTTRGGPSALPYFTHRPPGNGESDASIAFWLRKGHSPGKPLPQLAIREDAKFSVQNWTKKLFFANKDPKTNFDDWMIPQKHVLSFKCNDFFKMANLKAISSSTTLSFCDKQKCYIEKLHVNMRITLFKQWWKRVDAITFSTRDINNVSKTPLFGYSSRQ